MERKERRETREKKKKIIKRVFIAILIIVILAIIAFIANDYIIWGKNKTTNLVINNNNVTARLKNDVLIEDGIIYLSKPDLANFFDKYIYEEEKHNTIITT